MAATGIHDRFEVLRGRLGIRCGVVRDGIRLLRAQRRAGGEETKKKEGLRPLGH